MISQKNFSHCVFFSDSCPQCSSNEEHLRSPRSSNLSADLISDQVMPGCQECHRNSQRSNSRNRRRRNR